MKQVCEILSFLLLLLPFHFLFINFLLKTEDVSILIVHITLLQLSLVEVVCCKHTESALFELYIYQIHLNGTQTIWKMQLLIHIVSGMSAITLCLCFNTYKLISVAVISIQLNW